MAFFLSFENRNYDHSVRHYIPNTKLTLETVELLKNTKHSFAQMPFAVNTIYIMT